MGIVELITDLYSAILLFISSGLFIDEIKHGIVSSIYAAIFYWKYRDLKLSLGIVLLTYIIDSDHLVDYVLYYGPEFSFTKFIRLENFALTKRAFVPFHAWEWAAFAAILSIQYKKQRKYLLAFATAIVAHLTWDSITVGSVIFYSIFYRISQSFIVIS